MRETDTLGTGTAQCLHNTNGSWAVDPDNTEGKITFAIPSQGCPRTRPPGPRTDLPGPNVICPDPKVLMLSKLATSFTHLRSPWSTAGKEATAGRHFFPLWIMPQT